MSTATLLIVTDRLRSLAEPDQRDRPASPLPLSGRSRRASRVTTSDERPVRRAKAGIVRFRCLPGGRAGYPPACAGARLPLPRARVFFTACLYILIAPALPPQSAKAQEAPTRLPGQAKTEAAPTIGGKAPDGPCVIVEIAGTRSGHLDCATRRLQEAARRAQGEARSGFDLPIPQAGSADVQLGVANETATHLRMGSALGRSVHPERPASRPRAPRL